MSVLDGIVARTRQDVAARKATDPIDVSTLPHSDRDFRAALTAPGLGLIAEIKRRSPSKGDMRADFDPTAVATIYERHASAISVLTDEPSFGGHRRNLELARAASNRPLLAKDFFVDPHQIGEARRHGANAILLMASVLDTSAIEDFLAQARALGMEALVEVHDDAELERVLSDTTAAIVGVNSRDLTTLQIDDETIFRLAPRVREAGKVMVAESGVHERAQVERLTDVADAVLIGSSLMQAPNIEAKIESLGW